MYTQNGQCINDIEVNIKLRSLLLIYVFMFHYTTKMKKKIVTWNKSKTQHINYLFIYFSKKEFHFLCNNIKVQVSIVPDREWHGKVSSARNSMLKRQSRQRNLRKCECLLKKVCWFGFLQVTLELMSRLCSKNKSNKWSRRKEVNHDKRHFDSSKPQKIQYFKFDNLAQ